MEYLNLKIAGLFTSPNLYSEVPQGALSEATNIVISQDSIAQPRRGFNSLAGTLSGASNSLFFYQNKLMAHFGTSNLSYFNGSGWTAVSTGVTPYSTTKVRPASSNQNLYLTSSTGVIKLDAYNGTIRKAGAPKALDLTASTSASASTWLQDDYRVAYRVVWGYKDANKNLILGAPSGRESFKNTAGSAKSVSLKTTIPASILSDANYANWFYQLYRSSEVDNTSSDVEPNDELQLVFEGNPTSTDITNKYVVIDDIVPSVLRGATIYTAQSQQGLAFSNEPPPLAADLAVFANTLFYANTTSKHRFNLTLLSVGGAGIINDDTITIGGIAYTGKASENVASAQFQVVTSGSAAQNIRDTALSLIRVINQHSSSTVYAYYLSGVNDLPGQILVEELSIGGNAFTVTSSRPSAFNPSNLPGTSNNDQFQNGVFYSKFQQPEAVPLTNFFQVGSRDKAVLRIVPLRDSLFVFKEDGIWRISEAGASQFQVSQFDSSAKLLATESCAVLNNQIYCLTDQGVATVTETGVSIVSRPIEQTLLDLMGVSLSSVKSKTFGVAYESERSYILFMITNSGDATATQAFVFNTFTNTWVKWELTKTCGVVGSLDVTNSTQKDILYLGDGSSNVVNTERKNLNYTDFCDKEVAVVISSLDDTEVILTGGADSASVGDILWQSSSIFATILEVDSATQTLTIDANYNFTVAAAKVLKAIPTSIKWVPVTLGNPALLKQFQETQLIFKEFFSGEASASFSTDISISEETVPLMGSGNGLWGRFVWDQSALWGGDNNARTVRIWVPMHKQTGSYLNIGFSHRYGYASWKLAGVHVLVNTNGSTRGRR